MEQTTKVWRWKAYIAYIQIIKYNSVANAWICLFGVIDLNFKCRIRRGQRMDDIQVESPAVPRHHRKPLRN